MAISWKRLHEPTDIEFGFRQTAKERKKTLEVLGRQKKDPERKAIMKSLSEEVSKVYTNYCMLVQPRRPKRTFSGRYKKADTEAIALALFEREVTPGEFFEYWHYRVGKFTGKLSIVPLNFCKNVSLVEDVVANKYDTVDEEDDPVAIAEGNAFSAVSLDRGLRPFLTKRGFDLSHWNDQFLVTIQVMAKLRESNPSLFVAERVRGLVEMTGEFYENQA